LELVWEAKIADLAEGGERRYEASGVRFKGGYLHIVCDDGPYIVRTRVKGGAVQQEHTLIDLYGGGSGYEDVAYQPYERRWYCLIEAAETKSGLLKPRVEAFNEDFVFVENFWLDFPLTAGNKGIEGLSYLHYGDHDYLLGLCEGNRCKSGSAGREPGKGRIQVFRRAPGQWDHVGTIKLPKTVAFEDYASLEFRRRYVTVVSQMSSAMWVGRVRSTFTGLDDIWEDSGVTLRFPRSRKGKILYCNLEGVTWIGGGMLALVSDKAKGDQQPSRCRKKDQSLHIFRLPGGFRGPGRRGA
jgi:hypothetical protein